MATSRPFAYNTGQKIQDTTQIGDLAIGFVLKDYTTKPGNVQWWQGPDEDLGYVIALPVHDGTQPNQLGVDGHVRFLRSKDKTEESFIELVNHRFGQSFTDGDECKTYLNNNGYWTSWIGELPLTTYYALDNYVIGGNVVNISNSNVGGLHKSLEDLQNTVGKTVTVIGSSPYKFINTDGTDTLTIGSILAYYDAGKWFLMGDRYSVAGVEYDWLEPRYMNIEPTNALVGSTITICAIAKLEYFGDNVYVTDIIENPTEDCSTWGTAGI